MRISSRICFFFKRIAKVILPVKAYDKLRSFYFKHFIMHNIPAETPSSTSATLLFGVNLFVHHANNSAGVVGHLLQMALDAAEIPYQTFNLAIPENFQAEIEGKHLYHINLIACHAASETPKRMQLFGIDFKKHYNIGYWAWELAEVPDACCEGLELFQEIWTISSFCTTALEKKTKIPVLTVPHYANPNRSVIAHGREHFGFNKNPFLFMLAYDCNSFVARKNPQAVVKAFLKAFSPEDCHVGLVLKLVYPEHFKAHINELLETLAPYQNIYYIDRFCSDDEMRTLVQVSDAFVSLHRAEGFGLLPLEAMSLGTPVISTEWSGNMDYMNHMNTALVGYTMVPVNGQYVSSTPGDGLMWAEADVEEAAEYMRRMVSDGNWRNRLIAHGKHTADECFNVNNIGNMIKNRLDFLGFNS